MAIDELNKNMKELETIRNAIKNAKIGEAFNILDNIIKSDYPHYIDFIMLHYRYNKIKKDEIKGTKDKDRLQSEELTVVRLLLVFVDIIQTNTS